MQRVLQEITPNSAMFPILGKKNKKKPPFIDQNTEMENIFKEVKLRDEMHSKLRPGLTFSRNLTS